MATTGSPISNTRPSIAVSLGERSGLRQNSGLVGPGGGRSGSMAGNLTLSRVTGDSPDYQGSTITVLLL
jgi:hypothetical protein